MPEFHSSAFDAAQSYLFVQIAALARSIPKEKRINLGIGDIAYPLHEAFADQAKKAIEFISQNTTGYQPECGRDELKEAIHERKYAQSTIEKDEVFISDGITSDIVLVPDIFNGPLKVAILAPAYPLYKESLLLKGCISSSQDVEWLHITGRSAPLPRCDVDLIYITTPHNPTGKTLSKECLTSFVNFSLKSKALLLIDGAYEAFSSDEVQSIYDIPGADKCALEFRSFSKSHGFTGLRLGYTIVPKGIECNGHSLHSFFTKAKNATSNGHNYITQSMGTYGMKDGFTYAKEETERYLTHTHTLSKLLQECGLSIEGGKDSPYIWARVPNGETGISFSKHLANEYGIICIPGEGFHPDYTTFVRFSGFINATTLDQLKKRLDGVTLCNT